MGSEGFRGLGFVLGSESCCGVCDERSELIPSRNGVVGGLDKGELRDWKGGELLVGIQRAQ